MSRLRSSRKLVILRDVHGSDQSSESSGLDVSKLKLPDDAEWDRFFEVYGPRIHNIVLGFRSARLSQDVEDIRQDSFIKAYSGIVGFRGESHRLWPWLQRITQNVIKDRFRKWKKEEFLQDFFGSLDKQQLQDAVDILLRSHLGPQPMPSDLAAERELQEILKKSLAELEQNDLILIQYRYFQEMRIVEIANALGWNGVRVQVALFRARNKLKRNIKRRLRHG